MSADRRWQVRIEHVLEAIGKIERHIWVTEFISRSDSVAFVEYPVWMHSFPVGQVFVCLALREPPVVAMKGNIVADKNASVTGANGCNVIYLCSPYKVVAARDSGWVRYFVVETLKEVDVVPGINERACTGCIARSSPRSAREWSTATEDKQKHESCKPVRQSLSIQWMQK